MANFLFFQAHLTNFLVWILLVGAGVVREFVDYLLVSKAPKFAQHGGDTAAAVKFKILYVVGNTVWGFVHATPYYDGFERFANLDVDYNRILGPWIWAAVTCIGLGRALCVLDFRALETHCLLCWRRRQVSKAEEEYHCALESENWGGEDCGVRLLPPSKLQPWVCPGCFACCDAPCCQRGCGSGAGITKRIFQMIFALPDACCCTLVLGLRWLTHSGPCSRLGMKLVTGGLLMALGVSTLLLACSRNPEVEEDELTQLELVWIFFAGYGLFMGGVLIPWCANAPQAQEAPPTAVKAIMALAAIPNMFIHVWMTLQVTEIIQ